MSVTIQSVEEKSPAALAGIKGGEVLLSINGNSIMDVLDYRFYQNDADISLQIKDTSGQTKTVRIRKEEYEELGLEFETYLMDKKHSCRNKCIFCFIDQLPPGLRESLYFKDDDSRLSFLFGNYITLTNITEHEIERIIKMHISPINISVHTTNPELRVKMMANPNAGRVLEYMDRLNAAGIKLNCQLVLCPGYNDGAELERTLSDLSALENAECIAAVPVGLTGYRDGLAKLEPFTKETAEKVLAVIDRYGDLCLQKYGQRRIFAADEFYLIAQRNIPDASYYEDFLQLENGVGLWALQKSEAETAMQESDYRLKKKREVSLATGEAAYPLIRYLADRMEKKWKKLTVRVYPIVNRFFGGHITVSGLITATDLTEQLKEQPLGQELLIPASMLRSEGDLFLDSISLREVSERLGVPVTPIPGDGTEWVNAVLGSAGKGV